MSNVFGEGAGLLISPKTAPDSEIIVIKADGQDTVFAQAPVTAIHITQQTDFNLAKTLAGNFNLVVFQDLPVNITLSGLRTLSSPCSKKGQGNIENLYKALKGNADKRITIIIGGQETYQGVVVSLQQRSAASQWPGIITYNLSMFGVRSK